ncbi:MAG: dTDP-glucose 4,6-dehydratase [Gemmatimonas sp. SM23_52]|nr:MAG: dTDP-glucose 4,6-dehydratase [Gemmatimonas sp. SM23_52]
MTEIESFEPSCLLVTGGAGFIGSNFIRWALGEHPSLSVVNLDLLTYAGNLESLADVEARCSWKGDGRYYFVHGDIRDFETVACLLSGEGRETVQPGQRARTPPPVDAVIHMAAESHVDRSIMGPAIFVDTNVKGTLTLLEACTAELERAPRSFRFLHVGTDEVYGSLDLDDPAFTETTPLAPNSPYSASKAGADLLVRAYVETFELPAITTRCSNNYGHYQFPEKLIPLMISRALRDEPLPLYGDGLNVRDWLHVEDHAKGLWAVLTRGRLGEIYNIGGECEVQNIEIVRSILRLLEKPESLIRYVSDRRGHDRRYAMNITKMRNELGWEPVHTLEKGLAETVEWYLSHQTWWERVLSEAYLATRALYLKEG